MRTPMKPVLVLPLAVLAALAATPAAAQLVSERVENLERICTYRDGNSAAGAREYRVGLGEACSAYIPTERTSAPPPPTARLESTAERNGKRICSYAQRYRRWSFEVPLDTRCPVSAGMLAERQPADAERRN
jgi:hypothetical protein